MQTKSTSPAIAKATKLSLISFIILFIGSVGLDQVSKFHAEDKLMISQDEKNLKIYQGKRYPIYSVGNPVPNEDEIPFFLSLNFNYVRNQGAAWGALSDVDDSIRIPFFYCVTLVAVFVIALIFRSTPAYHRLARLALVLVLSGAFGNFLDRIRIGYVIDWIDVRWNLFGWRYSFPNFNFADSAITVGVAFLLIDSIIFESIRNKKLNAGVSDHSESDLATKAKLDASEGA